MKIGAHFSVCCEDRCTGGCWKDQQEEQEEEKEEEEEVEEGR